MTDCNSADFFVFYVLSEGLLTHSAARVWSDHGRWRRWGWRMSTRSHHRTLSASHSLLSASLSAFLIGTNLLTLPLSDRNQCMTSSILALHALGVIFWMVKWMQIIHKYQYFHCLKPQEYLDTLLKTSVFLKMTTALWSHLVIMIGTI